MLFAQTGSVYGTVRSEEGSVEFASVFLENTTFGVQTNQKGNFKIEDEISKDIRREGNF